MVNIEKLIAAISPGVYCKARDKNGNDLRKKVKAITKEEGYLAAAKDADIIASDEIFDPENAKGDPFRLHGLKAALEQHKIIYDSPAESLEPIYFWILDFLPRIGYGTINKLVDNFVSAPGSAHFSELGMKATKMQEEAMKTLGAVNQVLKSILNILYDLKQFKIRLATYEKYSGKESSPEEKQGALLSLKQIWLDSVDIQRGNTAIKAMAQQFDYVTLIDAFMAARDTEHAAKPAEKGGLDLNDRVKRIVTQRLQEFFIWLEHSEHELKKRFEIEKNYLRSQYNTIKLYARWVKPYLEAARKLEQNATQTPGLVTAFNTILLELSILAECEYNPSDDIKAGFLPEMFKRASKRTYTGLVWVDFKFRGIPQRAGQGYSYGGRTEVIFRALALNDQELKVLKSEIEKDDFKGMLSWIEGAADSSLKQIEKDIEEFLGDKKEDQKKEGNKKKKEEDDNPFTALFSFFKPDKKKESKPAELDLSKGIASDTNYEKVLRSQAIFDAREKCLLVFETYKKAHQMVAW